MIKIRKADKKDIKTIHTLRSRSILDQCSPHYSNKQLALWTYGGISDSFIIDVLENFYVSELNKSVIGCGKITLHTGMIDAIFVDPIYFGLGAAKKMILFLEDIAKKNSLKKIKLESTLNAASFYRHCGYSGEKVSTYESPRGISLECIPMEKYL